MERIVYWNLGQSIASYKIAGYKQYKSLASFHHENQERNAGTSPGSVCSVYDSEISLDRLHPVLAKSW